MSTEEESATAPGGIWIVLTTTATPDEAARMARALVAEGLAGCVQRIPIASTYRWRGEIVEDGETLVLVKTSASRIAEVEARIARLHAYECPEIVSLRGERVSAAYAAWLEAACARDRGEREV